MPSNSKVVQLQKFLNAKLRPSPNLTPDGIMGPKTRAAMEAYEAMKAKAGGGELITAPSAAPKAQIKRNAAADAWMSVAIAENDMGVVEIKGKDSNPRIDSYLATTQLAKAYQNDDTAWCSAFTNWVMIQAGYTGVNHALASKWLTWGVPTEPQYGAIVVVRKKGASTDASTGSSTGNHVGFVYDHTPTHCRILGGNQSGGTKVSIVNFSLASYEVRGMRWPAGL